MNKNQGFTLIELLVVVLIIGILSAVALPQYTKAVEKSRAVQGMALVRGLVTAQKAYHLANGEYSANLDELDLSLPGDPSGSSATVNDFSIAMHQMNEEVAHIQALYNRRSPYTSSWYIVYYFVRDKMYCMAAQNSVEGNALCKSFNPQVEDCPESGFLCYAI